MSAVAGGAAVTDFSLPSTANETFSLRAARGQPLVLHFYPRDNTPGCSLEAEDFQRLQPAFRRAGGRVCGNSRDNLAAHRRFCSQYGLGFQLLADEEGVVCRQFDLVHEKNLYGRTVVGIVRSTFLSDTAGKLRQEWRKVQVSDQATEVLQAATAL